MNKARLTKLTFKSPRFEMRHFKIGDIDAWKNANLHVKNKQNKFDDAVLPRKDINNFSKNGYETSKLSKSQPNLLLRCV